MLENSISSKETYNFKKKSTSCNKASNVIMKNISMDMDTNRVQPKVSFSMVEIRIYPCTLGDNPAAKNGVPLTLSWDYTRKISMSLDMFEFFREPIRKSCRNELKISYERKTILLKEAGFSIVDIKFVKREMDKIRKSREKTRRVEYCKRLFQNLFN